MRGEHTDPADPSSLRARHQGAAQLLGKAGTTQNPGVAERLKRGPQDNGGGRGPGLGGGAAARAGVRLRPEQSLGRVHTTTADIHVAPMAWKCRDCNPQRPARPWAHTRPAPLCRRASLSPGSCGSPRQSGCELRGCAVTSTHSAGDFFLHKAQPLQGWGSKLASPMPGDSPWGQGRECAGEAEGLLVTSNHSARCCDRHPGCCRTHRPSPTVR